MTTFVITWAAINLGLFVFATVSHFVGRITVRKPPALVVCR